MDITMIVLDVALVVSSGMYITQGFKFIKRARGNTQCHKKDAVVQQHFIEHLIAATTGLAGAAITFASSLVHTVEQNIVISGTDGLEFIERFQDAGMCIVLLSGILFMLHMRHEETPHHPFYCREYHEPE